jgi:hypothetical protein
VPVGVTAAAAVVIIVLIRFLVVIVPPLAALEVQIGVVELLLHIPARRA